MYKFDLASRTKKRDGRLLDHMICTIAWPRVVSGQLRMAYSIQQESNTSKFIHNKNLREEFEYSRARSFVLHIKQNLY